MFVRVTPEGDYNVKYDGETMTKRGDKYYIVTIASGSYSSHVSVSQ